MALKEKGVADEKKCIRGARPTIGLKYIASSKEFVGDGERE